MRRILIFSLLFAVSCSSQYSYTWQKHVMDGHRTGVIAPGADNVREALGYVEGGVYHSPSGKVFKEGVTPSVAADLIAAQPAMKDLKTVIGTTSKGLTKEAPESGLTNLIVDVIRQDIENETGKKVDVAFYNSGGIRLNGLPVGDILVDDIESMLPFRNMLCYVLLKGEDLRHIFEFIASVGSQPVSGARVVFRDRKPVSILVGGKPLDDNTLYGVGTNDFLLDGGDGITIAKNALELIITEREPKTAVMDYIKAQTAMGRQVDYSTDGRVIIEK